MNINASRKRHTTTEKQTRRGIFLKEAIEPNDRSDYGVGEVSIED